MSFLLALVLQEEWIRALESDDALERDEAEQRLIEGGPEVLKLVEPLLNDPDDELRLRARRIVDAVRERERRSKVLGPVVLVDVDVSEVPFRDVLRNLEKQSGFELRVSEAVRDARVTLRKKQVPYLEALTDLCRAHGNVRMEPIGDAEGVAWADAAPDRRPRFQLVAGRATREPVIYSGPFRLSIRSVTLERGTGRIRTTLVVRCLHQPNAQVYSIEEGTSPCVEDGAGREIRPATRSGAGAPQGGRRYDHEYSIETLPKTPRLGRVEGSLSVWFSLDRVAVRIDSMEKAVGREYDLRDFRVKLEKFEVHSDDQTHVLFTAWARPGSVFEKVHGAPGGHLRIRVLDSESRPVEWSSRGNSYKMGWCSYDWRLKSRPAAAELDCSVDFFRVEVPFRFDDISVPEW